MNTQPPGHLLWRCRRGMKELDLILQGWLERHYRGASAAEKTLFSQMLEWPDPEIAAYLLGKDAPGDAAWAQLLAQMTGQQCPPEQSRTPAAVGRGAPEAPPGLIGQG